MKNINCINCFICFNWFNYFNCFSFSRRESYPYSGNYARKGNKVSWKTAFLPIPPSLKQEAIQVIQVNKGDTEFIFSRLFPNKTSAGLPCCGNAPPARLGLFSRCNALGLLPNHAGFSRAPGRGAPLRRQRQPIQSERGGSESLKGEIV